MRIPRYLPATFKDSHRYMDLDYSFYFSGGSSLNFPQDGAWTLLRVDCASLKDPVFVYNGAGLNNSQNLASQSLEPRGLRICSAGFKKAVVQAVQYSVIVHRTDSAEPRDMVLGSRIPGTTTENFRGYQDERNANETYMKHFSADMNNAGGAVIRGKVVLARYEDDWTKRVCTIDHTDDGALSSINNPSDEPAKVPLLVGIWNVGVAQSDAANIDWHVELHCRFYVWFYDPRDMFVQSNLVS